MNAVAQSLDADRRGASLLARAIETDRLYFELGAEIEQLPGAVLAVMPGLGRSAGAAVIHRVDPEVVARLGDAWVQQTESALREAGAGLARIYMDECHGIADDLLREAGYAEREELAFSGELPDPPEEFTLRPVEGAADWERKLELHQAIRTSPDGHPNDAREWVTLEQRKCDRGMEAYLASVDDEIVGTVCAIVSGPMLRMKNVAVHPDFRRRSIGHSMIRALGLTGRQRGLTEQCVFAVAGDAGEAFYRAAGMRVIGSQVEWSKPLGEVR